MKYGESHSVVSDSLRLHGINSPWNSPGQNTGVSNCFLLQEIFPTPGSNPGLLHCQQILYQLSHQGSPKILEWVPYPFSRGSSWPRNWSGVSCIAGGFFTSWATKKAHFFQWFLSKIILFTYLAVPGPSCSIWTLSCGRWSLVQWPGIEPWPPAFGVQSLNHWAITYKLWNLASEE